MQGLIRQKELEQKGHNTPVKTRQRKNKNYIIWTALRLRRDAKFDKMRELERKHDTPVEWISKEKNTIMTKQEDGQKRATSQCLWNKRIEDR